MNIKTNLVAIMALGMGVIALHAGSRGTKWQVSGETTQTSFPDDVSFLGGVNIGQKRVIGQHSIGVIWEDSSLPILRLDFSNNPDGRTVAYVKIIVTGRWRERSNPFGNFPPGISDTYKPIAYQSEYIVTQGNEFKIEETNHGFKNKGLLFSASNSGDPVLYLTAFSDNLPLFNTGNNRFDAGELYYEVVGANVQGVIDL